jgi:hypothetical protein
MVKASDERMTSADRPSPASVAWQTRPQAVPAVTASPLGTPRSSTRWVTSVKLTPGVRQIGNTASPKPIMDNHNIGKSPFPWDVCLNLGDFTFGFPVNLP